MSKYLIAALMLGCLGSALAQNTAYPNKPVRIIVGQGVGGAVDLHSRIYATKLSDNLRVAFVVDHRGGLDVAAPFVARSAPDGYTLLAIAPDFATDPSLEREPTFNPVKEFTPVAMLSQSPYFLTVNPDVPAKSIGELIKLAKARPGVLNIGGGLPGAGSHLVAVWFLSEANIKGTYVPYKAATNSLTDLVAGRLDAAVASGNALPYAKLGKIRILGTTLARRSRLLPDVPTIAEQGIPGFATGTYRGFVAPAGTPPAIINRLAEEIAKVAALPETVQAVAADGSEPYLMTPDELRKFIEEDVARWRKVIEANNIPKK